MLSYVYIISKVNYKTLLCHCVTVSIYVFTALTIVFELV